MLGGLLLASSSKVGTLLIAIYLISRDTGSYEVGPQIRVGLGVLQKQFLDRPPSEGQGDQFYESRPLRLVLRSPPVGWV